MDRKDYQRVTEVGRDIWRSTGLTPTNVKHGNRIHVPGKLEGIHNSSRSVGTSRFQTQWDNFLMQL